MEANNFESTSSGPPIKYSEPFSEPRTIEQSFSSTMSAESDGFETYMAQRTLASSIASSGGGMELCDNKGSDFEAFEKILFGSHYEYGFASGELEELLKNCDDISFDDALSIKQTTNSVSQFTSTIGSGAPHFSFTFPIVSSLNNEHGSCIRKVTIEFSSTSSSHHAAEINFSSDGHQSQIPQPLTCHAQKNKDARRGKTTTRPRKKPSSGAVAVPKKPKTKSKTAVGTTSSPKTKKGAAKKKESKAKKPTCKPKKQTTKRVVAKKTKVENVRKICPMQCRVVLTRLPERKSRSRRSNRKYSSFLIW